jgi:hypothetical protein
VDFFFENHSFNPISENLECRLSKERQSKLLHRDVVSVERDGFMDAKLLEKQVS